MSSIAAILQEASLLYYLAFRKKFSDRAQVFTDLWTFYYTTFSRKSPLFCCLIFSLKIFISLWILELCRWYFVESKYSCLLASCKISAIELKYSQTYENFKIFCLLTPSFQRTWKSTFFFAKASNTEEKKNQTKPFFC